jgi:hypothetical protein
MKPEKVKAHTRSAPPQGLRHVRTKTVSGQKVAEVPFAIYKLLLDAGGNMTMQELAKAIRRGAKAKPGKRASVEDAGSARIIARSDAALAAGLDVELPADVAEAIIGGKSPLRAVREWRGMTQVALSEATEIDQGTISDMERTGGGKVANWRAAATELRVPLDLIVPEE